MCESAILNEENAYPLNYSNREFEKEYEDHITSDYVIHVLTYAKFKQLYIEFQELLELERPWTEDEDRRVSELCDRLGY